MEHSIILKWVYETTVRQCMLQTCALCLIKDIIENTFAIS